ncbi:MAG: HAD family phosphatase [Flavobacteriales bacterium]|nr:HAD family phosphatase [Flavobacteriales bacterium]
MPIKNIIFDLGGVILDIDYNAPIREFAKLNMHNLESIYSIAHPDPMYSLYETGKISTEEFMNYLYSRSPEGTSPTAIFNAWNSILVGLPPHRIEILKQLKQHYRLFLLSNINELHIEGFEAIYRRHFPESSIHDVMDKVYYSCRIGKRKPEADSFLHIVHEQNLELKETLFIDDSAVNVAGALQVGLLARRIHPEQGETFEHVTKELLKLKNQL